MTPEEGVRLQIEAYRRMTPQERLQIAFDLYEFTKNIARQGIKSQHPEWTLEQIEQELLRRLLLGAGISLPSGQTPDKDVSSS